MIKKCFLGLILYFSGTHILCAQFEEMGLIRIPCVSGIILGKPEIPNHTCPAYSGAHFITKGCILPVVNGIRIYNNCAADSLNYFSPEWSDMEIPKNNFFYKENFH